MENKAFSSNSNKIFFSYPTLIREGMQALPVYPPEPLITGIEKGSTHMMVITVGLSLSNEHSMYSEVDIFFNGVSLVIPNEDGQGRVDNTLVQHLPNGNKNIHLSNLYMNKVLFPESGCYEVTVKVFIAPENPDDNGVFVDSFTSYFYVETLEGARNGTDL